MKRIAALTAATILAIVGLAASAQADTGWNGTAHSITKTWR